MSALLEMRTFHCGGLRETSSILRGALNVLFLSRTVISFMKPCFGPGMAPLGRRLRAVIDPTFYP